ncbi:flagellar hook-associated protein FlgK [Anaeroselena agilis]|uniref:Flagellar hook-associated protein 1 n=1 Tax=Anaeroselena agilis TaxID=3063788 RepID=A0ABU3NZA3_9FIRM|nr:flagellar hook-associated protein FlgK [Selenomonadales bacterium 4137-cl]
MASTFGGVRIADRGLSASQIALATTTNNISNVNTTGYSRQTVNQIAVGPAAVYSRSTVGNGTEVTSVTRVNSFRLDQKYWTENSSLGYYGTTADYLGQIEVYLDTSATDTSFSDMLSNFYSALEALATDNSAAARTTVLEYGQEICAYFNEAAEALTELRSEVNLEVKTAVEQVNSYAGQIAELNQRITVAATSGAATNELEDRRDLLIDELSKLTDISVTASTVYTAGDGTTTSTYTVTLKGSTLVSGTTARKLECYTITDGSAQDGMYGLRWTDSGTELSAGDSGTLAAYLDIRDGTGENGDYKGILYYMDQLNDFARTFAEAFNEGVYADGTRYYAGHAGGYGLDGTTGTRFFTYGSATSADIESALASGLTLDDIYANVSAANISLTTDVTEDVNKIAASSSATDADGNNENANDLIEICQDTRMFGPGSPVDCYDSIIATLGTENAYASRQSSRQSSLVAYIDDCRSSVSGVSTNEETAYLTKYQEAYAASAQALTTWSEVLATTVNMVSD